MHRKLKKPSIEQKTCGNGPTLGFEYLLTYKTLHCMHGIPVTPMSLGPHKRGQNKKWLHHPYLLGGLEVGRIAM